MTLSGQVVTPKYLTLAGDPTKSLISAGSEASPITLTTTDLPGVLIHVKSTATSGKLTGISGNVSAGNASGTLALTALHGRARVPTGITTSSAIYGVHTELEALGTASVSGLFEGHRIEQYVESGTTFASATVYALHVANSISKQPGTYDFIRLSEDGSCYVDNIFTITKGASCTNMKYLFYFSFGAAIDMVATVGAVSGTAGYLKIKCNTLDRYIQLYSTPP